MSGFKRHTQQTINRSRFLDHLFFGALLLISLGLNAQRGIEKELLDSLAYIADTSDGEAKVDALISLERTSQVYGGSRFGYDALKITKEALSIAEEIGYLEGEIVSNLRLAYHHNRTGYFQNALSYAYKHIYLTSGYPDSVASLYNMMIYSQLSISYRGLHMFDSARYYITESLELARKTGDCKTITNRLLQLGNLYSRLGDHDGELQAYMEAYNRLKYCADTSQRSDRCVFARLLGYYFMTHGNYKEALKYFFEADSIYGAMRLDNMRVKGYHAQQASNIARVYQHWGKLDSALTYRRLALNRYFDYGFSELDIDIPNQYCYIGMLYREKGDFISAREYLEKSLDLRKCNGDSLGVGMSLDELAIMAKLQGNYQLAVQLLQESLSWKMSFKAGQINPQRHAQWLESQAETYFVLGQVFAEWNKHSDALLYYDTAYMLNTRVDYKRGLVQVDLARGMVWEAHGIPDTALQYLQRSLDLAITLNNRPLIAQAKEGLWNLYTEFGAMSASLDMYNDAMKIYIEDGFIRKLPGIYLSRGEMLYSIGSFDPATQDLLQAYHSGMNLGMIRIQADASRILAEIYAQLGDHSSAYQYLKDLTILHDSIFTLETHRQLAEMQAFHESQQQALEIDRLEQDNEINSLRVDQSRYVIISLGGLVIIILLFALLYLRQIQVRNEQRTLLNQQKLFRSQMNPHFIFNSLTNIQHYIFKKDSLSAGKYLAVFAKLMRSILNNSRKEIITLKDEIATITQYLELQQLRMEDKLEYKVEVDAALDQDLTQIPPMLAQPFIENAIEHGIRNKEGRGLVSVRIKAVNKHILYEVEDDGIGRIKALEHNFSKKSSHESMAVTLTRSRLNTLWGRKNKDSILEIIDLEDEQGNACGTLVRFKIPL